MSEYQINFEHAGSDHILSNLRYEGKEHSNETYSIILKYYSSKLILKISRRDNHGFDSMQKKSIQYKCIRIDIAKIIEGEIDESLYGFIKFLEYCFDYELIDIIDHKLQWRVKKIE